MIDDINLPTLTENNECDQDQDYKTVEAQAALILQQLAQENQHQAPVPDTLHKIRKLVDDMRETLDYEPDADTNTILHHQARALDNAFRRLLQDADTTYQASDKCEFVPMKYAAAFKAQEQFCRTIKAINALKKKEKPKKKPRKKPKKRLFRRNERTEGIGPLE